MSKADIGLVGLAVMGENLILNMESKGFTVAAFNRTTSKVDDFLNGRAKGKNSLGARSVEELVSLLKRPIIMAGISLWFIMNTVIILVLMMEIIARNGLSIWSGAPMLHLGCRILRALVRYMGHGVHTEMI